MCEEGEESGEVILLWAGPRFAASSAKPVCLVLDCAGGQVATRPRGFFSSPAVLEDHCESETLRCALRVNESLWARTLKVPRFLGDPAAALRKVLTNFSRATSSDEVQYMAGHLAVCAAATHEECGLFQGGFWPPRGHLTFMWKPSKISQQELIGGGGK